MSQTQCHSQFLWKSIGYTLCLTILRDNADHLYTVVVRAVLPCTHETMTIFRGALIRHFLNSLCGVPKMTKEDRADQAIARSNKSSDAFLCKSPPTES